MADNIAQLYPARVQPDGRVFYRGVDQAGKLTEGWTDQLSMAHPHYRRKDAPEPLAALQPHEPALTEGWCPPTEIAVTYTATEPTAPEPSKEITMARRKAAVELDENFNEVAPERVTQYCHYPLPPETPRPPSKFGAWGWYKLPNPETGLPTGYPRATTIAKTLDDQTKLTNWKIRERCAQVLSLARMAPDTVIYTDPTGDTTAADALGALDEAMNGGGAYKVDAVLEMIDNVMGGAHARELGECVHAWLEALDMGIVLLKDVPELVRPHIVHARRVMAHRGIVALPQYVERTVLNGRCAQLPDPEGEPTIAGEVVAGKIDRIYKIVTTGDLVLGDVKTSKSLEYSWLTYGVQIGGVYGWAEKMLALDGASWEDMPEIRDDFAILLHVPSNQPELAAAITIDMWWGAETFQDSIATRLRRKEAKTKVPQHAIPVPSKAAVRYAEARLALTEITTAEDGQRVFETYQDVWDDDLNEFGGIVAELV